MTLRTAACSCGQLHIEVQGDPVRVSVCHCLACQRRTGSAFGVQARFARSGSKISGRSTEFLRVGDEGTKMRFHFCPLCGSTVYFTADGKEDLIVVPMGAFADPHFPRPTVSVYEERMHQWVGLPAEFEHIP